ncbi:MAG TPA: class I SAM-dependent methyltransferase [Blastocatellia bacterium]|nr:class I SAM-dependent methyltransferase [Blastocatellia bacterium]
MTHQTSDKEQAFLYDLFIVPGWREVFDQMVDEEIEVPEKGRILDAGCGTGGYAVSLAAKLGADSEVVGVDTSAERLELARGKAEVQKVKRVSFESGSPEASGQAASDFDLVIGDASMHRPERMGAVFAEMARVARPGASVVVKLATHGSFDEFFSIYWEALHDLGLEELTPQLEKLITERLTVSDAEELAKSAGLKGVRSVTQKERFDYANAEEFLSAPLMESSFLDEWLAILPDENAVRRVRRKLADIIDRERHHMDFDVSIKATLIIGRK